MFARRREAMVRLTLQATRRSRTYQLTQSLEFEDDGSTTPRWPGRAGSGTDVRSSSRERIRRRLVERGHLGQAALEIPEVRDRLAHHELDWEHIHLWRKVARRERYVHRPSAHLPHRYFDGGKSGNDIPNG